MIGFGHHLARTVNPACIAVREERESLFPGLSDLCAGTNLDTHLANDKIVLPPVFEGDHFGLAVDYTNDSFPWPDDDEEMLGSDSRPLSEPESDSDLDAEDLPIEDLPQHEILGPPPVNLVPTAEPMDEEDPEDQAAIERCCQMGESIQRLCRKPAVVVSFGGEAGKAISEPSVAPDQRDRYDNLTYQSILGHSAQDNPWYPFNSKLDWEVAKWAKLRGPSDTSFSDLLAIEGVSKCGLIILMALANGRFKIRERLTLSYKDTKQLNEIIDKQLPCRPTFHRSVVVVDGICFDVYFRDVIECIKALYGDPEFAPYLVFAPEKHYSDKKGGNRLYHDLHTGRWWWSTQVRCATII